MAECHLGKRDIPGGAKISLSLGGKSRADYNNMVRTVCDLAYRAEVCVRNFYLKEILVTGDSSVEEIMNSVKVSCVIFVLFPFDWCWEYGV